MFSDIIGADVDDNISDLWMFTKKGRDVPNYVQDRGTREAVCCSRFGFDVPYNGVTVKQEEEAWKSDLERGLQDDRRAVDDWLVARGCVAGSASSPVRWLEPDS